MKKNNLLILLCSILISCNLWAQETAVSYLEKISSEYKTLTEQFLSYSSAVAHSKNARKIDSRRTSLINSVNTAISKVSKMPAYEGDKSLRDSAVAYLKITKIILTEDYAKIVNMEEVAEQSYDAMEAYLLAREIADKKHAKAGDVYKNAEAVYAAKFNINLVESNDEIAIKARKAANANNYNQKIYLIFFKCHKQEAYLLDAIAKNDINAIEQNKNALLKNIDEANRKLDTIKPFNNDATLKTTLKNYLSFYKTECVKLKDITDYIVANENFAKEKKGFESKKDRTQADVDQYNKSVNEINTASNKYNITVNELNESRTKMFNTWSETSHNFLDKHVPKYK